MKLLRVCLLALSLALLAACASIPQESVRLNTQVGLGLKKQHQAQVELVNAYIAAKRQALDEALAKSLETYFQTLAPRCGGDITLNADQLAEMGNDVMDLNDRNNAAKEELERVRDLLIEELNDNYLALNQANAAVTGLLQSAVDVKEAQSEALESITDTAGLDIDLDQVFAELDEYVVKSGQGAGKAIDIVKKIKSLLGEGEVTEEAGE